jgi:hypothetical protein
MEAIWLSAITGGKHRKIHHLVVYYLCQSPQFMCDPNVRVYSANTSGLVWRMVRAQADHEAIHANVQPQPEGLEL